MLTVIGLGNERGDLTLSALKALKNADRIYVKNGGAALAGGGRLCDRLLFL